MSENEVAKLYGELKEVNAKIDNLTELFNRASYGDGFTRCATEKQRVDHLEDGLELCNANISVLKKWMLAGLISILSVLANFAWDMVRSSIRP